MNRTSHDAFESDLAAELADTRLLQEISATLVCEDGVQALYERIVDAASAIARSDFASMQMLYPERGERGELRLLASRGFSDAARKDWAWVRIGDTCTCGLALANRRRFIAADVETCEAISADQLAVYRETGIRAVQTTPLLSRNGDILGMISTHWREPGERELRLLDILARQGADLIERNLANEERERLLAEAELARSEAERANRAKDEFLAVLSHELRSPLNAMLGWTTILKRAGSTNDLVCRAVETLERNIRTQAQVINDLLDISRITSGKLRLERSRVDLVAALHGTVDSMQPLAEGKRVRVELVVEDGRYEVEGDVVRLQQVAGNVLHNAIKFTPEGGSVRLHLCAEDGEILVEVRDSGPGIDPVLLPHVFDRFVQSGASTTRRHGGLGLGLAIVSQLTRLHGGTVDARNHDAGGTVFTIRLPLLDPCDAQAGPEPGEAADPSFSLDELDVLLVEDDQDSRDALCIALELGGIRARVAGSVRQALEAYELRPPDVLVSDIGMPDADGYSLIRNIREREDGGSRRTLAIAISGFATRQDHEIALRAGFDEHVGKPVEPEALLERIRVLAELRGLRSRTSATSAASR